MARNEQKLRLTCFDKQPPNKNDNTMHRSKATKKDKRTDCTCYLRATFPTWHYCARRLDKSGCHIAPRSSMSDHLVNVITARNAHKWRWRVLVFLFGGNSVGFWERLCAGCHQGSDCFGSSQHSVCKCFGAWWTRLTPVGRRIHTCSAMFSTSLFVRRSSAVIQCPPML